MLTYFFDRFIFGYLIFPKNKLMANDGALTDKQIADLAKRMGLDLAFIDFKSDLLTHKLEYNRGYVGNRRKEHTGVVSLYENTQMVG
jgi:hypothetical protein